LRASVPAKLAEERAAIAIGRVHHHRAPLVPALDDARADGDLAEEVRRLEDLIRRDGGIGRAQRGSQRSAARRESEYHRSRF
jgi:hypothetical protein